MLEKPDLPDRLILSLLQEDYGLHVRALTFLPLGADVNTAVYHVDTGENTAYFLKLRMGDFQEIAVSLPHFLKSNGIREIITPLETLSRLLWTSLETCKIVLYPYIEGRNGYEAVLSDLQWRKFGMALKGIHAVQVPKELAALIPRESFTAHWRDMVTNFQAQAEAAVFEDPTAARLAGFMRAQSDVIHHIVARADTLGLALQSRHLEPVLCHSDIHPGNLLICPNDHFYIVDWDNPIFAPKEKDLLLIGGCFTWQGANEETLFYQGYSSVEIDPMALAYYRYERIIQDIAAFCEQLFLSSDGGEDREQAYEYFTSSFLPRHEIEYALRSDQI